MSNNIEQQILDAAIDLFFAQGRIGATSQEIADYAKVPRTSINYYFRSVKVLYDRAKKYALQQSINESDQLLLSDIPLKEKVEKLVDAFNIRLEKYPYLEGVIMAENNVADKQKHHKNEAILHFLKEVKEEMNKGTIPKYPPQLFFINLMSVIIHPYFVQNINKGLMEINDINYSKLMKQRKKVIIDMLFPFDIQTKK